MDPRLSERNCHRLRTVLSITIYEVRPGADSAKEKVSSRIRIADVTWLEGKRKFF